MNSTIEDPKSYYHDRLVEEQENLLAETRELNSPIPITVASVSLDTIFEKIGFGIYQLRLVLVLGLVAAAEGAQITIVTLCMTILQNTWDYSNIVQSILIAINFVGIVIGGFFSGAFADRYGRTRPILVSLVLITIFHLLSAFAQEVILFGIARFLIGFFIGFSAPIGFTIVVENMPKTHRGKLVMIALSFLYIGQLIECLIAFVTIDNLLTGDWRALVIWSTSFLVITLILNLLYLDESLRFELIMGKRKEVFDKLDKMIKYNNSKNCHRLTEEEKQGLNVWVNNLALEVTDNEIASVKSLFKPKYKTITLVIWLGYFITSFIYYGIVLCLPYMLTRISEEDQTISSIPVLNNTDLSSLSISIFMETASVIIAIFVIDGIPVDRRKILAMFYLFTAIACGGALIGSSRTAFVFWTTVTKIFVNVCSCYYYLFTVEIYPTKYRATGTGIAIAIGKFGTIAMPFICLPLTEVFLLSPFVLFIVLALLAGVSLLGLTINTKEMDLK